MIAVIHFAYGAPASIDDIPTYFSHIIGGREVPPPMLEKIVAQFKQPAQADFIASATQRIAQGLQHVLPTTLQQDVKVYNAYKHTAPFLEDAVTTAIKDGATTVVTLPINPIFSPSGAGAFHDETAALLEGKNIEHIAIKGWNTHPAIVDIYADRVSRAIHWLPAAVRDNAYVYFTVHSQPIKPEGNEPYVGEFQALADAIAQKVGVDNYAAVYRSSGGKANWLAPDVKDAIRAQASEGTQAFVTCELLSLAADVESFIEIGPDCEAVAKELNVEFVRAEFPGDSFDTVMALAQIVKEHVFVTA
ncbi:ferrochelatase [Caryophanon tenue]|uniref:Coproporphyrin III ferrochelatase n=1 Tax=Caryophanon tenue TaxID=33978 RepID=A0A1C0YK39_9BACL|nr:ferrochelatase [Caryophanon tenue]OCS87547.1 hypothetical protein A6M13_09580 [Caryophanon tenue]